MRHNHFYTARPQLKSGVETGFGITSANLEDEIQGIIMSKMD